MKKPATAKALFDIIMNMDRRERICIPCVESASGKNDATSFEFYVAEVKDDRYGRDTFKVSVMGHDCKMSSCKSRYRDLLTIDMVEKYYSYLV